MYGMHITLGLGRGGAALAPVARCPAVGLDPVANPVLVSVGGH